MVQFGGRVVFGGKFTVKFTVFLHLVPFMLGDPPSKIAKLCQEHILGMGSMEIKVLGQGEVKVMRYWQLLCSFQKAKCSKTHIGWVQMMGQHAQEGDMESVDARKFILHCLLMAICHAYPSTEAIIQ